MIKIKKLLTSLASLGVVASAASLVVSCGPSFNTLKTREIDPTVYKTTFSNNIQNWNMAATMQSNDFKILANTQDTLMTYDNDSDLLKPKPLLLAEEPSFNGNVVTLTLRKDANWYDFKTGEIKQAIVAQDIKNTGLYAMDKNNGSELSADWKTFVGDSKEDIDKNVKVIDDKTLTITLKDENQTNYFESALTTGSFAPTPDIAVKELKSDYGRGINYSSTWLSGPYYVDSYINSYQLVLKRNPNYTDENKGTIDTIKYSFSSSSDSGKLRTLFETGDTSEAIISPSDSYGYKHYVGNFDGLEKVNNNLIGSKYLWFNFSKQHVDGSKSVIEQEDLDSNKALSLDSVRKLIFYGLDRSTLVKYFAGSKDAVKDFTVDTFNPSGYLKMDDGSDYTKSVLENEADDKGNVYYHNQKLLDKSFEDLVKKVKDDLGGKTVTLKFLTSGVNATTFNPYIRQMLDEFNNLGTPVKIVEEPTSDDAAYQQAQLDGNYSMFITGETPTYIDPLSFLVNLQPNGPMSLYDGMSRLFDDKGQPKPEAISKYGVDESLIKEIQNYQTKLTSAKDYASFAEAEKDILFNARTILPLYKPNGKYTYNLSYMEYDTRPNKGFGYQDYRLDKVKLAKSIQTLINEGKLNAPEAKTKAALVKQN